MKIAAIKNKIGLITLCAALLFIWYGLPEGFVAVLRKAVFICLECIGLG